MIEILTSIISGILCLAIYFLWEISRSLSHIETQINSINFTSILAIESELQEIKHRIKDFESYLSDISNNTKHN